jgi:hypothetical protein
MSDTERRNFAFVSSGDPEQDARIADDLAVHDERIQRGECPNGDGLLVTSDDPRLSGMWECPRCGFGYVGPARWLDNASAEVSA